MEQPAVVEGMLRVLCHIPFMTRAEELRNRTKAFALSIINLARILPNRPEAWVIGKQVIRSGTSVAANYRAVGRARSKTEFVAKLGIGVEEADETVFWLELLRDSKTVPELQIAGLIEESRQLLAIFAASQRTVRSNSVQ